MTFVLGLILASAPASAQDAAEGAIDPALYVDITPDGFDAIAGVIPALLPSEVAIPDTSQEVVDIWFCAEDFSLTNGLVGLQVIDAQVTPGNGALDVTASLMVSVNSSGNPFNLSFSGCVDSDCPGYVDAFPVDIHTTIALAIVPGPDGLDVLDATVGAIDVSYVLDNSDIHLDCFVQDIEDILGYVGLSIYDLIIDQVDSLLQDQIGALAPTLESTVEDAFSAATIDQDLDLNGATAHISLAPTDIQVLPTGVRLAMGGWVSGDAAACVSAYDTGGPTWTENGLADIGYAPTGVRSPYHLGIGVSDDFANQTLYTLWRGGLLCYTLAPGGVFPLDTSIMNLLTGNVFAELFPESQPVTMRTVPRAAPTVDYTGSDDINVTLKDLDVELYADLDGRAARIVSVSLNGPAGANLALDGGTGNLGIAVHIDPANLVPTVVYNEIYPDQDATVESSFATAFGGLLDTLIGGLVGDALAFALPSISGLGLQSLETSATGPSQDWLGAYAMLGSVTYGDGSSCGGCGGTDTGGSSSSGCSSGCAQAPGVPAWMGLLPLGLAVVLRRRP